MRLWRALESVHGWAGVRSVWREHLGDELEFLQPLLRPMEQLAMSVPWPGTIEGRRVVVHDEDDIVAVDRETSDASPISRTDVVLWRLDAEELFRGVASAIGLQGTPASVGVGNRLWWLGEYTPVEGERFPVYLATTRDAGELVRNTGYVSALSQRPFVLTTPSRGGASEVLDRLVQGRAAAWVALEELLTWEGEGVFAAKRPLGDALRAFVAQHIAISESQDRSPRFPTPSGATWSDVLIRFKDGHTVSVAVLGCSGVYGYADLGMCSGKNNAPTKQWELLRTFAEERGVLTWSSRKASPRHRKQKQLLGDALRRFFGIEGDPFAASEGGWRTKFSVEPDA